MIHLVNETDIRAIGLPTELLRTLQAQSMKKSQNFFGCCCETIDPEHRQAHRAQDRMEIYQYVSLILRRKLMEN